MSSRTINVVVVATESGRQPLTYQMRAGDLAPLYTFSAGKVALSFYSEAELKRYFAQVKRHPHTERTICTEAAIRRQLKQIRATGFGHSRRRVGARRSRNRPSCHHRWRPFAGILNISVPEARMDNRLLA